MRTVRERFFEKVGQPPYSAACWIWTASHDSMGYGHFFIGGVVDRAHRASWLLFNGEIPDDLCVLHKCDNPKCVNPDHLFLGTKADNNADKMRKGRHAGKNRTHCKRNHPLTGDNLYISRTSGARMCKECGRIRGRINDPIRRPIKTKRRGPRVTLFADGTTPADTHEIGVSLAASGASVQRGAT